MSKPSSKYVVPLVLAALTWVATVVWAQKVDVAVYQHDGRATIQWRDSVRAQHAQEDSLLLDMRDKINDLWCAKIPVHQLRSCRRS